MRQSWLCLLLLFASSLAAQSNAYKVQVEDQLQISFWENPNWNSVVTVGKDGEMELPIIGRITAAGLSIKQLREKIISQMALYNKLITQLSIVVTDYGSNRVFITGQVRNPGRYSFEEIPNLWDIILEAGGHLETSFLDQVVVVRKEGDGQILTADISQALREGKLSSLPEIYPGDTIHVPGTTATGGTPSPLIKKDEVYILGAVGLPGAHKFETGLNIVEVIGRAGGPTSVANLKKVQYVSMRNGKAQVMEYNLENYFKYSVPHPVAVGAGDTIFVPWQRGLSPIARLLLSAVLSTTITSIITVWIIN
jgi:polysaccharide export outer membrane protein